MVLKSSKYWHAKREGRGNSFTSGLHQRFLILSLHLSCSALNLTLQTCYVYKGVSRGQVSRDQSLRLDVAVKQTESGAAATLQMQKLTRCITDAGRRVLSLSPDVAESLFFKSRCLSFNPIIKTFPF